MSVFDILKSMTFGNISLDIILLVSWDTILLDRRPFTLPIYGRKRGHFQLWKGHWMIWSGYYIYSSTLEPGCRDPGPGWIVPCLIRQLVRASILELYKSVNRKFALSKKQVELHCICILMQKRTRLHVFWAVYTE